MKDSRDKEIMEGLGMPNSQSLLSALQQVANEVAQQVHSDYEENNKKLKIDQAKRCKYDKNCARQESSGCSQECDDYPPVG